MTKHLDEIIALCEEVLNGETFLEDSVITEIKDIAQQAKEDAEPSPFSILNRMTPTSVTFSGELISEREREDERKDNRK